MLLDHLILHVNDVEHSVRFYTDILGLTHEGRSEPFTILRVTAEFTIQLAPWGTQGGEHLAFAMSRAEFTEVFRRLRDTGVQFGDSFHAVGNMKGPGREDGARGLGASLYFFYPNAPLIEIRHYEKSEAFVSAPDAGPRPSVGAIVALGRRRQDAELPHQGETVHEVPRLHDEVRVVEAMQIPERRHHRVFRSAPRP